MNELQQNPTHNNGCSRISTQCVDVSAPLALTPSADIGNICTTCQGIPTVQCITNEDASSSYVILTQKICVTIPVRYGVNVTAETPCITCSDHVCSDGDCGCQG